MLTLFSEVKDEVLAILQRELVDQNIAAEVRKSRGYDTVTTPYVIVTTRSYYKRADTAHIVKLTIATIARFIDATGEEEAEEALDNVEQVCINMFDREEGMYQVHVPFWQAVDRDRETYRPFSPIGPYIRYSEQYLQFIK